MKKFRIDFTQDNPCLDGCVLGRIGEHNATELIITPPAVFAENEAVTSYVIAFVTGGRVIHSEPLEKAETLSVKLWQQLTMFPVLGVQLEAYDNDGEFIGKSGYITGLKFLASAHGVKTNADTDNPDFVSAFFKTKHFHENKETLDKFSEDAEGKPLYDGKKIGGGGTGTGLTDEQAIAIEANTAARHLHENKDVLDLLGVNIAKTRLTFDGSVLATNTDVANNYAEINGKLYNNYYTKTKINEMISAIPKFSISPVDVLPTEDISETTVYLLKEGKDSSNLYTEYIYVNGGWEPLGTQTVDLTGYETTSDVEEKLNALKNELFGDVAEEYNTLAKIAAVLQELNGKSHSHSNKSVLDNFTQEPGILNPYFSNLELAFTADLPTHLSHLINDKNFVTADEMGEVAKYISSVTFAVEEIDIADDAVTLGTGWSGSNTEGYTHTSGNIEPLSFAINAADGEKYIVEYDCSASGDAIMLKLGNAESLENVYPTSPYNGGTTNQWGLVCSGDNGILQVIPISTYTGFIKNLRCYKITENGEKEITVNLDNVGIGSLPNHIAGFYNFYLSPTSMQKSVNGTGNVAIGYASLRDIVSGGRNIGLGTFSLASLVYGENNIGIGADAGLNLPLAENIVAIGKGAAAFGSKRTDDIAIGRYALTGKAGAETLNNIGIGVEAGRDCVGKANVFIGASAGAKATVGGTNVFIGNSAGTAITTGWGNTFIGANANADGNYSRVIVIGNGAKATKHNQAVLGGDNITETVLKGNVIVRGTDGAYREVALKEDISTEVENLLTEAKESGEFDGKDGYTPIKGTDYWTSAEQKVIQDDCNTYIAEQFADRTQLTPEYANDISECTDTTKLYILPDGYIYAYMLKTVYPEITIEKGSGGFWQFMSYNAMVWQSIEGWYAARTNIIPVKEGDILSYSSLGNNDSYCPAVVWFDSSQSYLSNEYGKTEYTAPNGAAYAQFYTYNKTESYAYSLSVSWVLCQDATSYQWSNTGHAFVPADYEDRIIALENRVTDSVLCGKKIVYDGDSICESRTSGAAANGGAFAKLIADKTGGTYENQAVSGARLVTLLDGYSYHSIVDNLPNLPTDGDLYCFDGGLNDYWTADIQLGTYDLTNFDGELDTTTVCGALETIFRYCLNNFIGKPICFVIAHKAQSTAYVKNANGKTFKDFRDAMVGICEKYSIPYYDAFSKSGLNGWNTAQNNAYLTANSNGTPDGCHPNEEGYKRYYVPQLISLFESVMPID